MGSVGSSTHMIHQGLRFEAPWTTGKEAHFDSGRTHIVNIGDYANKYTSVKYVGELKEETIGQCVR